MTNKTKLSAAALFSALVLGGSFVGSTVFAGTVDPTGTEQTGDTSGATDSTGTTDTGATTGTTTTAKAAHQGVNSTDGKVTEQGNAYVEITTSKDGNPVVTPGDPDTPVKPIDEGNNPNITNETGTLTLDAIPNTLNFGVNASTGTAQTIQLLSGDQSYKDAQNDTRTDATFNGSTTKTTDFGTSTTTDDKGVTNTEQFQGKIFAQETNVTADPNVAWTLNAKLSHFTTKDNEEGLTGAKIILANGVSAFVNGKTWAESSEKIVQDENKQVILDSTNDAGTNIIVGAKQKGVTQQQWATKDVTLSIPNAATVGQYKATIDWTLSAVPTTSLDAAVTPGA
ncbi:WxL domain-containing protein [Lacticaseibacillus porcinae]|uniref:WxL domain-containing protein n=1 Tax=Lacticaseibacillus porcinae TaxID=1123687 RepID=UPI000F7A96B0|nr:WxL domain-containing protein [Lacticaseibacillus porcinae]